MKKIVIILSVFFAAAGFAGGQKKGNMEIGIYGAWDLKTSTYSQYYPAGAEQGENDGGSGASFGAGLNYFFYPEHALVLGAGYQFYQPTLKKTYGSAWGKYDVKAAFITFLLGYRHYRGGFFGGVGFDLGLVSQYKIRYTTSGGTDQSFEVGDPVYNPKGSHATHFGIYGELGYSFLLNTALSLDVSGKYKAGLSSIYTDKAASVSGGFDKVRMRVFCIQMALNYNF